MGPVSDDKVLDLLLGGAPVHAHTPVASGGIVPRKIAVKLIVDSGQVLGRNPDPPQAFFLDGAVEPFYFAVVFRGLDRIADKPDA